MDEMKLQLTTKFMRGIVSKLITKAIQKKYGCNIEVQLNNLAIDFVDGETKVSTNVEVKLGKEDFFKILKTTGLED